MTIDTVVVTGGTGGISVGISTVLSEAGFHVIAASASPAEIAAFAGPDVSDTRLLDVTNTHAVTAFFHTLSPHFSPIYLRLKVW